jgi:hypothetical protein
MPVSSVASALRDQMNCLQLACVMHRLMKRSLRAHDCAQAQEYGTRQGATGRNAVRSSIAHPALTCMGPAGGP